jgi:hypothetical protein
MDRIGVVNGVVGAVLGMLFAVLFQQLLQDAWYRLRRRSTSAIRSLGRREESGPAWRAFSLGPLQTSALIVEGDGESPTPPDAVHVSVLDGEVQLPSDMAGWRDEVAEESGRLRAEGRLLREDPIHRWATLAPALFHLSLVHVYGRTLVQRTEAQILRRL